VLNEVAPPSKKHERMIKHIKKRYAKDGELTDREKSIAYATAWKDYNKKEVNEKNVYGDGHDYDAPGVTAIRFKKDGSGSNIRLTHSGAEIASRTRKKTTTRTTPKFALDKALIDFRNQDDPAKNLPGMKKEETIWERLKPDGYVMSNRERREDDAEKARKERNLKMRYGKRWREFTDEAKEKKKKEEEILARYKEKKEKGIAFSDKYGTGYIKDGKKKYNYRKKR
tara:strand:- start:213 stop:890 length:678 start_codon:yes stop_codon:yes gene_type:complete